MTLKEYLEKALADKDYKHTAKALVIMEATDETLTFASIADILDSEASYLNMYFVSDDKDDNGVITLYISETND